MTEYGTDNGPACKECEGTIWFYESSLYSEDFMPVTELTAKCVSCGKKSEYTLYGEILPDDIHAVKAVHARRESV